MVNSFSEFCDKLLENGFSMGGGNAKGIYAIISFDWKNPIPGCPIVWHTGNPETDPWEWRMRVLEERSDIAYGKVFFGTSGYITKEWYPFSWRFAGRDLPSKNGMTKGKQDNWKREYMKT